MKRKTVSPIVTIVIILAIVITASLALIWWLGYSASQPNGSDGEVVQKEYHLGDLIYADNIDYYYYHGIDSNHIVIGHWVTRAMSNMYIEPSSGQFYIEGTQFKIIDGDMSEGWIILERSR